MQALEQEKIILANKMGRFERFNEADIYSCLTLDKVKRIVFAENNGRSEDEFDWKVSFEYDTLKSQLNKKNIPALTSFEVWEIAKRYSSGQSTKYIKEYLEQWRSKEMMKRNNNKNIQEYSISLKVSEQRIKDVIKMIKGN